MGRIKVETNRSAEGIAEAERALALDPNLAKHPDGGVPLNAADKRALVAFLRTLTDDRFLPRAVVARVNP